MSFSYSYELHDFNEAITPYGTIETRAPSQTIVTTDDFTDGTHFRTGPEDSTNALILELEDRLLTLVLDESGSMTWNDNSGDRYVYYKRLLDKLNATYPGSLSANLIGFGGVPSHTELFIAQSGEDNLTNSGENFTQFVQSIFQDSVFDFAGVRIVRRTDRFPTHPADGVVVAEGILTAVKDKDLVTGQTYYYGIWTFNKDLLFSRGQFVRAVPYDRILPQGVNFASSTPRILPGVERDDNTALIYNLVEGAGYLTFDSSGNGYHGTINSETVEENFWSGDASTGSYGEGGTLRKPIGVRLDGEFDVIETTIVTPDNFVFSTTDRLIVSFWVYRYEGGVNQWIIGASTNDLSNNVDWAIGTGSVDGRVAVVVGDISAGFGNGFGGTNVPINTWTMVSVSLLLVGGGVATGMTVYINGTSILGGSSAPTPFDADRLYIGAKPEDSGSIWAGNDFFGSLAQISVRTVVGISAEKALISDIYNTELPLFDQPISQSSQNPPDNGQREVLLSWEIGDDFDYSGGTVKIMRKYESVPSHAEDGDVVVEQSASVGTFFYLDTYDFINNSDYYYRVFTFNSLGNSCAREDARILPAHIPLSVNTPASPALSSVSSLVITPGNKKLMLQWENPTDSRWVGTRVYFGEDTYPSMTISPQGEVTVSNGMLLTDTTDEFYIHRTNGRNDTGTDVLLVNGKIHYYTIITYDRLNRFSNAANVTGVPSALLDTVFTPEEVTDVHVEILNPQTLSVQWNNPTVKSNSLELYFGESALIFASLKDIFGGNLEDVDNLQLKVCTTIQERNLKTSEQELRGAYDDDTPACGTRRAARHADCKFGSRFDDNCNTEQEEFETNLIYAAVESGLIKGLLGHINDRRILARRQKYVMSAVARYKVVDPDVADSEPLFQFTTESVRVSFEHPIRISAVNKLHKYINVGCQSDGGLRGTPACLCPDDPEGGCVETRYNGGYTGAAQPYMCRVEMQYKGESLPEGTPINVQLYKHGTDDNPNPLDEKSDRTFIREGVYTTSQVFIEELNDDGNPTGNIVQKSIADIEMPHPVLPDFVDIYITLDHAGFFIDAVHQVRFIGSLFISADISHPSPDGIDVAEQFAVAWILNPDNPDDASTNLPVPDGTLVKWELSKLLFAKERPFYSAEIFSELLAGVYSTTTNGVARNIFFGPVGNIQNHFTLITCNNYQVTCCVGEEYAITASIILDEESARDGKRFSYSCSTQDFTTLAFLMNGDVTQPFAGGPQSAPHWITWADGIHMLKFQIAQDPNISTILGADCFRRCSENVGGQLQLYAFPDEQVVQINAPAEILWNVVFDEDPYTGAQTVVSYSSVSPQQSEELGIPFVANIPLAGQTTDFYLRLNSFVNQANPRPEDCELPGGGGGGGGGGGLLPCEWLNACSGVGSCQPVQGIQWVNVASITGSASFIANNKEIALQAGGDYANGMPPIYIGFMEPLTVRIVDARVNGERVNELVVDGVSRHTFTVEVQFAGESVPDGTVVELNVRGEDSSIVILSSCASSPPFCVAGSSGTIFTRKINDLIINPQDDSGTVSQRSFAYFSIEPLPDIKFNAKIDVTCRYDQLSTVERNIISCVEVNNTVNVSPPETIPELFEPTEQAATTNELIVYDTIQDLYESTAAGEVQRMGHFAGGVVLGTNDSMCIFGGYTGSSASSTSNITPLSEIFNATDQQWRFTTDMPTARAYGMSVVVGTRVYCIGGIELDPLLKQYSVSRKLEVFDVATETWMTLSSLPVDYGVAYGDAQHAGGYIYVTCGITSIIDSSKPGDLNDYILRYSIDDDSWISFAPSDVSLYQRVSPFGFYRSNPTGGGTKYYYIYGGSIPKSMEDIQAERTSRINALLDEFRAFILGSTYYQNLTLAEQKSYLATKEQEITDGVVVSAFIYPRTGFKFEPGSENLDMIDDEWTVLPTARDHGQCVYIPHQDIAYFMGGSNQNQSTTLNRVESIDLARSNNYQRLRPFNRGRAMFAAVNISDDIYLTGGLTSGHRNGYVQIEAEQFPDRVEARGTQGVGMLISLKNDSGELISEDVRVAVRGRLRMNSIDSVLSEFYANRAADRALGGDGSGNAPDLPVSGEVDVGAIIEAQNKIIDPNSDEFQFNAARKLGEQVFLFPILYSQSDFLIKNGIGYVTLLPRSEDPLSDFQKLSAFISETLANTPEDPDERFQGDLTREELAALGDVLSTVTLPPTVIDSGALRELYQIETSITLLDEELFGQTVSEFDLDVQEQINSRIEELLTPDDDDDGEPGGSPGIGLGDGGSPVEDSECFLIQHSAQPDVPEPSTPPQGDINSPVGTGGYSQSGQCLFCQTVLPLNVAIRLQLPTLMTVFFNIVDWVPQIKKRLTDSTHTIMEVLEELDIIDHEVPFGGSQLYNALFESARITAGDDLNSIKKSIYVVSDNSQNLSLVTRDNTIEEINAIDGDRNTPVVYSIFSTSFPVSLATQLQRTEIGDIEKITQATGGQSTTLVASGFLDQILNLTLGGATGGLGYGIYTHIIDFGELSALTAMTLDFTLPSNTQGFVRFRHTSDGFDFTDFSERFEGSGRVDFVDFFATQVEIEVILTTGFTEGITEEYDSTPTGVPKLNSIVWETSAEQEDFIWVNQEDVLTNTQQVAMAFEGHVPENAIIEMGVASSDSHNWNDFQTSARPAVREFGKMFMLERTDDVFSLIPTEPLVSIDQRLYTSVYGPWDPESTVSLFEVTNTGTEVPVLAGFRLYPREGEIYFATRQPPDKVFKLAIVNSSCLRVGIRLRNRLHTDSIVIQGMGYIYSTNDEKPVALTQVAPRAINALISPQNPTAGDTIFALYDFVDLNNDVEQGTIISWFKNGRQLLEIQNEASWVDDDLLASNKLEPVDKIGFSVTPSDGRDFGSTVFSPTVTIVPRQPGASDVRIVPTKNGVINDRFDTGSTFTVEYEFQTDDSGPGAVENGTVIKWFVDGILFKEGIFSLLEQDPYVDPKSIDPGEIAGGVLAHEIGNQIQCEVTPKTLTITGETTTSQLITVENSVPSITNAQITPLNPSTESTLQLSYDIVDTDISNGTQENQSEIRWLNSANGTDFAEISALSGEMTVPPFYLTAGEQWKVEVTPYDGLDIGSVGTTNTVTILAI